MNQLPLWDFCYRYKNADGEMKYGCETIRAICETEAEYIGKSHLYKFRPFVWNNLDDTKILPHREYCSHVPPLEGF